MSRWIERNEDGTFKVELASMDECEWLYNEVCCNDSSDICCDFPHEDYCEKRCPYFTKENGIIKTT